MSVNKRARIRYRGDTPTSDIVFELENRTIHVFQTPTEPALDALVNTLNNDCSKHYPTYVITGARTNATETYQYLKARVNADFKTKSTGPPPALSPPVLPPTAVLALPDTYTLAQLRENF